MTTDHPQHLRQTAADPDTPVATLAGLATSTDLAVLTALIHNPSTSAETLRVIARTPRIGVRKALLDSERCPLVSSIAEDRLAFEGVDIGLFVDERSKRRICRALIGTAHRAETSLVFSDPTFRVLDCLRTLHSLFTIHGGKKRDRKLNRHDYLRFIEDFNARGGDQAALDLPFITLLNAIRILGRERLVQVLTADTPDRAKYSLRLLEAVVSSPDEAESARQQALVDRWIDARGSAWTLGLHDYLSRKHKRRINRHRNRPPRTLYQARFRDVLRDLNQERRASGYRVHLPRTERELKELGAAMANCVGSEHNISDAVDGRHFILHAHPHRARRRGVTCQFNEKGRLIQARGFANGDADETLIEVARQAMVVLQAERAVLSADSADTKEA